MEAVKEKLVQVLDETLKAQLTESYRCLQSNSLKLVKTTMEVGWDAAFIERHNGWEMFGYKHQHECRVKLGIGYSNWYRVLAIANCFSRMVKAEYLCMKLESAEILGRQPEEVRYDPENIEKASSEPVETFKARFVPVPETKDHPAKFELKMTHQKKEVIEQGLREFMADNEIDNASWALELIVAEYTGRPTFTGFINKAIPKLTEAIRSTEDLTELKLFMASHIQEMGSILKQCCGDEEEVA